MDQVCEAAKRQRKSWAELQCEDLDPPQNPLQTSRRGPRQDPYPELKKSRVSGSGSRKTRRNFGQGVFDVSSDGDMLFEILRLVLGRANRSRRQ